MKYLFWPLLFLAVYSCGKSQQTEGAPYGLTIEQVFLTEIPESHFLPFNLDNIEVELETTKETSSYIANNKRNKIYNYYRHVEAKFANKHSPLEIKDLEWAIFPKLNVKDKESIFDGHSKSSLRKVKIIIPESKAKSLETITYSLKIQNNKGEITYLKSDIGRSPLTFNLPIEHFLEVFIKEESELFISVSEATYKNNKKNWSIQKEDRENSSLLEFTLNPFSIFYPSKNSKQFVANQNESIFSKRDDLTIPLNGPSITVTLPEDITHPKKRNFNLSKSVTIENMLTNHFNLKMNFSVKNYKLKTNTKNVTVGYKDNSCQIIRGEPVNCSLKEQLGTCSVSWTTLEEEKDNPRLTEEELKLFASSIQTQKYKIINEGPHFYVSSKRQQVYQEVKIDEKIELLHFSHNINLEKYKIRLSVDKSNCRYVRKMGLHFIGQDAWLNDHNKEVYTKEVIPFIEFYELYR